MELIYCTALSVVSMVCGLAVLHPRYEDNLVQRIGLALAGVGSFGLTLAILLGAQQLNASTLFAVGVAVFALGTVWKHRRRRSWSRSTDGILQGRP